MNACIRVKTGTRTPASHEHHSSAQKLDTLIPEFNAEASHEAFAHDATVERRPNSN
jgi:hypothetical protein